MNEDLAVLAATLFEEDRGQTSLDVVKRLTKYGVTDADVVLAVLHEYRRLQTVAQPPL